MTKSKSLAFAVVVGLASLTIDICAHLLTNTTVHFPYVSIKFIVIAFTLYFFSRWIGVDWKNGIAGTGIAVILFYVYYRFTEPTLDRTIFKLDERVIWTLFHWVAVYIPYWLTWKYLLAGDTAPVVASDQKRYSIIASVATIIGILFLFPTKEILAKYNLFLGLTYNDHVLVGILGFIVAIIAAYKLKLVISKK